MNIFKTLTTTACGAAAVLALGGFAHAAAYTYVSSPGTVTVFDATNFYAHNSSTPYAGETSVGAYGLTNSQVPSTYNTIALAGTGAEWVTGYMNTTKNGPAYASAWNGDTYDFVTTITEPGTSSANPFTVSGTVLSDNVLESVSLYNFSGDLIDTIAGPSGENSNGTTSYSTPFDFSGLTSSTSSDYLVFAVQNQNQGSSASLTSNPVSIEYGFNVTPAAVPEPGEMASFAIGGLGLLGLALRARRSRRIAA
jgi:hypothetical protein